MKFPAPEAPRRPLCPRCARPGAACLCDLVAPVRSPTPVLVLQHPQEQRQAKNSVGLLRLSLAGCEVVVGEHFADAALQALLQRDGRQSLLLYPDVPAAPAPAATVPAGAPLQLVVIDATWRKSLRMLQAHPRLAALPRLALGTPPATLYRRIRAARRPDQISTLEATLHALARLDGDAPALAPLLQAFDRFTAREQARARQRPADLQAAKV